MAKSASVTVVVTRAVKADTDNTANNKALKPALDGNDSKVMLSAVAAGMAVPKTKAELLNLYRNAPLDINNSVHSAQLQHVNAQRVGLYQQQLQRTELLYTVSPTLRPTYLVQALKPQFLEFEHYKMVQTLDQRGIVDLTTMTHMWQQLHIVDDLIADIMRLMPAQEPVGWQLTSVNKNHLKLPTVGRLRDDEAIADQASLNSYVLGHFGVMSYTYDRAYFIGHVLGYLFCCYYLAHLSIAYGVTPLPADTVADYDYVALETAKMVRLLQGVDVHCKRRIYQLAVFCARLSSYKLDKHVEQMLITEVNEFDKKQQIAHLETLLQQGVMPDIPTPYDND